MQSGSQFLIDLTECILDGTTKLESSIKECLISYSEQLKRQEFGALAEIIVSKILSPEIDRLYVGVYDTISRILSEED